MLTDDDMLRISAVSRNRTVDEERAAVTDSFGSKELIDKFLRYRTEPWPEISLLWDTSIESQRFSLDNVIEREFREFYPEGLLLAEVTTKDLDAVLPHTHRQPIENLWDEGDERKIARLLAYISAGHAVSPPLVTKNEGELLAINGGTHRYAIAKRLSHNSLLIYVPPEEKEDVEKLLPVNWC